MKKLKNKGNVSPAQSVSHGSANTEDLIRWLEDPDQTISTTLRFEIAERLRSLRGTFRDLAAGGASR